MASPRVKPRLLGRGRRASVPLIKVKPVGAASNGPTFSRFTAIWVQSNGVPFDTTGFFARLYRGNTLVQTASFDRFGVVRFSRVTTLTQVAYTIRVFDSSGVEFRRRNIPAGVETFAIIG